LTCVVALTTLSHYRASVWSNSWQYRSTFVVSRCPR